MQGEGSARLYLGEEALDFVIEVLGSGVHSYADGVVWCGAKRLASPVGTLVEPGGNFHKPNGIDFVNAAGFRVVADGRRVARDGQEVAHSSDAPRPKQRGLQPDKVLIARRDVGHSLDAARLEGSGEHQR